MSAVSEFMDTLRGVWPDDVPPATHWRAAEDVADEVTSLADGLPVVVMPGWDAGRIELAAGQYEETA